MARRCNSGRNQHSKVRFLPIPKSSGWKERRRFKCFTSSLVVLCIRDHRTHAVLARAQNIHYHCADKMQYPHQALFHRAHSPLRYSVTWSTRGINMEYGHMTNKSSLSRSRGLVDMSTPNDTGIHQVGRNRGCYQKAQRYSFERE